MRNYNQYEKGKRSIPDYIVKGIANILKVDESEIFKPKKYVINNWHHATLAQSKAGYYQIYISCNWSHGITVPCHLMTGEKGADEYGKKEKQEGRRLFWIC